MLRTRLQQQAWLRIRNASSSLTREPISTRRPLGPRTRYRVASWLFRVIALAERAIPGDFPYGRRRSVPMCICCVPETYRLEQRITGIAPLACCGDRLGKSLTEQRWFGGRRHPIEFVASSVYASQTSDDQRHTKLHRRLLLEPLWFHVSV